MTEKEFFNEVKRAKKKSMQENLSYEESNSEFTAFISTGICKIKGAKHE